MGLDQEFISVEEAARRHPLIDPSRYIAALWDPLDGDIDPSGVTYAYAKAAKALGRPTRPTRRCLRPTSVPTAPGMW